MLARFVRSITKVSLFAIAAGFLAAPALAQSEQQKLISESEAALSNFLRDPEMKWLQQNFKRAKAVLIAPARCWPVGEQVPERLARLEADAFGGVVGAQDVL